MGFQVFGSPVEGLFTNFYAAVMPKCIVNGMSVYVRMSGSV